MLSRDYVYKYCFLDARINYTMNMVSTREKKPPGNYPSEQSEFKIHSPQFLPPLLFLIQSKENFFKTWDFLESFKTIPSTHYSITVVFRYLGLLFLKLPI